METIKEYIESMFKNLPQSEKVLKAKKELLQMMEDKYEELKKEGKSENEAIGTVISEFGNLEELAQELGIGDELEEKKSSSEKKVLGLDVIKEYFKDAGKRAFLKALSTAFVLVGVAALVSGFDWDSTGLIIFFVFLALSVGVRKYLSYGFTKWEYIDNEKFVTGGSGKAFVKNQYDKKLSALIAMRTVGKMLCVLCIIPFFLFERFGLEDLSVSGLFLILSVGNFLKEYVKHIQGFYDKFSRAGTDGVWFEGVENIQPVSSASVKKASVVNDILKTIVKIALIVLVVFAGVKIYKVCRDMIYPDSQNVQLEYKSIINRN